MDKFRLTTAGMASYNALLEAFNEQQRLDEAAAAARDSLSYIIHRFELPVQQLELLRDSNKNFLDTVGYCFAAAIAAGRPVGIRETQDDKAGSNCCILASLALSVHFMDGGVTSSGKCEVTLST